MGMGGSNNEGCKADSVKSLVTAAFYNNPVNLSMVSYIDQRVAPPGFYAPP
ncbi:hypothetical protein ABIF62_003135 [Bradyrhizobium japonicum]